MGANCCLVSFADGVNANRQFMSTKSLTNEKNKQDQIYISNLHFHSHGRPLGHGGFAGYTLRRVSKNLLIEMFIYY
jgi:hypothetical protein